MTSFLQRLALRDSGALPVLKPRLPGLFEPPAGVAPLPIGDDGGADDGPVPAPAEQGATPRRAWPAAPRHVPRDEADVHPARVAQPPARPRAEPVPPAAAAPALPLPPAPYEPPTARRPHAGVPAIEAQAPALVAHAPPPRPRMAPPAPRLPVPPTADRPPIDAGTGALRRSAAPPPPALTPSVPIAPDAVRAARAAQPAPAAPLPTVQVTIGRVDVRATQAPAAPVRQASRAQPTSLDEYLRQRDGRQEGRR